MVAVWPNSIPAALSGDGDYTEGLEELTIFSAMDAGNIKARRRFTRAPAKITGTIEVSKDEVNTFLSFFYNTIGAGSLPFTGALTRTGGNELYRFTKTPSIAHMGGDSYKITLELIRIPQ